MKYPRIAHISDLHLSPIHKRMNIRRTKVLLEHIRRLEVDHIVITGDIVANGEKGDFRLARELLISQGLLDSRKLSVVIGNHDVYGGVHTPEEILEFPRKCRKTDVKERIKEFQETFREAFVGVERINDKSPYPYLKPIGDVLLIGLNSVAGYSLAKNPVGSNGEVNEHQLKGLDKMLSSGFFKQSRRIVMIHHHFTKVYRPLDGTIQSAWHAFEQQTMKLRGKRELIRLFKKHHIDAILHGHVHENLEYRRKGLLFVNGGGSILCRHSTTIHLNVLHLNSEGVRIEHHEFPVMADGPVLPAAVPDGPVSAIPAAA